MAILTPQNLLDVSLQNVYRPYNYTVRFSFPDNGTPVDDFILGYLTGDFMVNSASIPELSATTRTMKVMGRDIILPNKFKSSGTWTCTFYVDELGTLKSRFDKWIAQIDQYSYNTTISGSSMFSIDSLVNAIMGSVQGSSDIVPLFGNIEILPGTFVGSTLSLKNYTLYQAFPIRVGEIKVGDNMKGQLGEFSVEFAYNSITVDESIQIPGIA